ncbi:DHH family phosphoesterase [Mycoplasmopsis fermentans]|nr:bifunctional oligoribonuclease/PAP phosphatase NrnA [Mycoplasmopsis fermentans]VEU66884.1 Bifunctional oligoribonuclease and PAP phosphatase nrnA [Mesomycoplasma conjunctivae]ADN68695.1 predicted mgpA-like protein [Mycoplasmopsis fermentans JER]ADV34079.1 MgpA-like protein [Mycoplasmopsis fermentans M64]RMX36237.1 DHHA1 domain protein [Mycoplasmopsis fermentans MF-I2]RMX36315.1 DHHA1 domain protein [Mycoplasmopsis fermentans MF-I1]
MKIGNYKVALQAIEKYKNIIIFHHIRPDGDCLGSQAGLAELIKKNYPKKKVFTVGDNVHTFDFMSYHYDPIETVDFKNSLGIVVDASSSDRIQDGHLLVEKKCTAALRIDHHPNGSDIEYDYLWIDEHYVAAAEMVAMLAKSAKWEITKKAAEHIYLGINTDSGRFLYPDTSARTYKLVAHLIEKGGLDSQWILRELNKRSSRDIKYTGEILSGFKQSGRVLYFEVTKEIMDKYGMNDLEAAIFVNELANIDDNSCWAFFIQLADGTVRCRLRSNGPLVNNVARLHNGGGHDNAAGCSINSWDEVPVVLKELNDCIKEWEAK